MLRCQSDSSSAAVISVFDHSIFFPFCPPFKERDQPCGSTSHAAPDMLSRKATEATLQTAEERRLGEPADQTIFRGVAGGQRQTRKEAKQGSAVPHV